MLLRPLGDPIRHERDCIAARLLAASASYWSEQGLAGSSWLLYVCQVRADVPPTAGSLSEAALLHSKRLGLYAQTFFTGGRPQ